MKIPLKGWGVIAALPIRKDEITCNYNGDLISIQEADEREVGPCIFLNWNFSIAYK